MKKSLLLLSLILIQWNLAKAQTVEATRQVGDHAALFTFEKNENPENIMIVYTKLDSNCQVVVDPNKQASPIFDMYWLMNGTGFKPVHSLIKNGVIGRLEIIPAKSHDTFQIQINDLKELQTDVQEQKLTIVAQKSAKGACEVKSFFTLGASDKGATMQVKTIYSEAAKTMLPPFRKLKSVTLKGVDSKTGEKLSRTYKAK
ncbi:MAG: hypothetical protein H7326_09730 [Bdellovibrionaceae bacterium]|nr:hypothetical protein [Pseudobdellovibrionaceae bacterium]